MFFLVLQHLLEGRDFVVFLSDQCHESLFCVVKRLFASGDLSLPVCDCGPVAFDDFEPGKNKNNGMVEEE